MVLAVAYRQVAKAYVVGLNGFGEPLGSDAYGGEPVNVRDDEYLREDQPAEVHHRHFRYLLYTLGDDAGGQTAQLHGAGGVPDGHVDEEGRDVGGAGLEGLGPLGSLRQGGQGPVYPLVDLHEDEVDVGSVVEAQSDDAHPALGLGADVGQRGYLHELAAQGLEVFVHLTGGAAVDLDLYCNLRDVHVRHKGDRYQLDGHRSEDRHGEEHHGDRYRPFDELADHCLTMTLDSCARLRLPEVMTASPSSSWALRS